MIWNIDTAHTTAAFKIRHMGISNVRGSFSGIAGTIETDELGRAIAIKASIPVETINTGNTDRDNHLKAADFFDVAQFPTIDFASTTVTPSNDGYTVEGQLTMHGVSKAIRFETEAGAPATDPFSNKKKLGGDATLELSRKDYGLTWNAPIEAGGVMVGDKVTIQLDVQAVEG